VKFLTYFCLLVLISACASAPPPKNTPVKPKAKEPVAKVYSFEPPVVPEPEEVTPSTATPGGRESGGIHGQYGVAVLGVTRAGVAVNLSQYRGKPVLVNYWASWCPPCWAEMAQLEDIYLDYHDRGLEIVAVNFGESDLAISNFLQRQAKTLTFTIAADPDTKISREIGVRAVPTTLLFDSEGKMVKKYLGLFGFDANRVRNDLNELLGGDNRS
jgi:thiol-disulfide isomerase/thioredoxin